MRLSSLQKFILLKCADKKDFEIKRGVLLAFYDGEKNPPRENLKNKIITASLESLIDRGLAIGYGRRTPRKWFMSGLKLTNAGIVEARRLLGEQMKLPLKR
jgi:hypothetical protein